jgi:hypothetical protein
MGLEGSPGGSLVGPCGLPETEFTCTWGLEQVTALLYSVNAQMGRWIGCRWVGDQDCVWVARQPRCHALQARAHLDTESAGALLSSMPRVR